MLCLLSVLVSARPYPTTSGSYISVSLFGHSVTPLLFNCNLIVCFLQIPFYNASLSKTKILPSKCGSAASAVVCGANGQCSDYSCSAGACQCEGNSTSGQEDFLISYGTWRGIGLGGWVSCSFQHLLGWSGGSVSHNDTVFLLVAVNIIAPKSLADVSCFDWLCLLL